MVWIPSLWTTFCFDPRQIRTEPLNEGGPGKGYQLCGGKPWTILKSTQWLSDAIYVKQDDLI